MPKNLEMPAATAAPAVMTTLATLAQYLTTIVPPARRAIARWRRRAERIGDPELRALALSKHDGEHLNAEAAAVFSVLAPRHARRDMIELHVAYQLAYDYLDAVSEQPHHDPLANGLQLHQALLDALARPGHPASDPYARATWGEGEYLPRLIATCRALYWRQPAAAVVHDDVRAAALHCAEAQAHTHAAMLTGRTDGLRAWAEHAAPGTAWWETAAGGISSLGIHALLAASSTSRTTPPLATATTASYASVCAFSTMLDSLVDQHTDHGSGNFSYIAHYPNEAAATNGIQRLARTATHDAATLPAAGRHQAILAGLAGYYLSDPGAHRPRARAAAAAVLDTLGPSSRTALRALQARRAAARRRSSRPTVARHGRGEPPCPERPSPVHPPTTSR